MTGKAAGFSHFDSDSEMQNVAITTISTAKYLTSIMAKEIKENKY